MILIEPLRTIYYHNYLFMNYLFMIIMFVIIITHQFCNMLLFFQKVMVQKDSVNKIPLLPKYNIPIRR